MIPQHITDLIEELKACKVKSCKVCYGNREYLRGILWATKEELTFLNSGRIKILIHDADIGACHDKCKFIENRKVKLKEIIKEIEGVLK